MINHTKCAHREKQPMAKAENIKNGIKKLRAVIYKLYFSNRLYSLNVMAQVVMLLKKNLPNGK